MSYLKELIDNPKVNAVRNANAPKGVYVILNRNKDGKVESTDTVFPNNPKKQHAKYDMRHFLFNDAKPTWDEHKHEERSSADNVKAAVEFIKTWLSQGKDTNEKLDKASRFVAFIKEEGKTEIEVKDVFPFLLSRNVESELLLVKFITDIIQKKS